jgi:hypothetical protein
MHESRCTWFGYLHGGSPNRCRELERCAQRSSRDHLVVPDTTPPPHDLTGLRVLHVVQKYSSGVGSAIAQYTRSLPTVEQHLLSGTPVDAEGDLAEQAEFASTHRMLGGHLAKVRQVRDVVRKLRPDVMHAHYSHGGAYARLAVRRGSPYLVYTPHCYAFERWDVSAAVRGGFLLTEGLLALNTSAFAACSIREWRLSGWPTRHAPRYLVPNIAPTAGHGLTSPRSATPLVVGGGRLSPQKPVQMPQQVHWAAPGVSTPYTSVNRRPGDPAGHMERWKHLRSTVENGGPDGQQYVLDPWQADIELPRVIPGHTVQVVNDLGFDGWQLVSADVATDTF